MKGNKLVWPRKYMYYMYIKYKGFTTLGNI